MLAASIRMEIQRAIRLTEQNRPMLTMRVFILKAKACLVVGVERNGESVL